MSSSPRIQSSRLRPRRLSGDGEGPLPLLTPREGAEVFRPGPGSWDPPGPLGFLRGGLPRGLTSSLPVTSRGAPEVTGSQRRQRPALPRAQDHPQAAPPAPPPLSPAPRPAPEELLQAGIAETVAAGGNLHRLAHGLPAQWAQQPSLGLLQELVVEARHGGRAAGTGERGQARNGPTARASLERRSRLRAAPTGGRGQGSAVKPARRKRGRGRGRAVLMRALAAPPTPECMVFGSGDRQSRPPTGSWAFLSPGGQRSWLRFSPEPAGPGEVRVGKGDGPRHKGFLLQRQQLGLRGREQPRNRGPSFQVLGSRSLATSSGEPSWGGEAGLGAGPEEPRPQPPAAPTFLPWPQPCHRGRAQPSPGVPGRHPHP